MSTTRSASPRAPATDPDDGKAALLLVAHGAADASASASRHAAEIAGRGRFAEVRAACLKGTPVLEAVLAETVRDRIYLVPLLMAEGYSYGLLRRRLAAASAGPQVTLCQPVGASPGLADVIAEMALATCRGQGWLPVHSALVLVGHGTSRHPASTATALAQVERLAARDTFAKVAAAFLEEPPDLAQLLQDLTPRPVVVVGFFADRGVHGEQDVPRLIAESGVTALYSGPVGERPELAEIVLDQVGSAQLTVQPPD